MNLYSSRLTVISKNGQATLNTFAAAINTTAADESIKPVAQAIGQLITGSVYRLRRADNSSISMDTEETQSPANVYNPPTDTLQIQNQNQLNQVQQNLQR